MIKSSFVVLVGQGGGNLALNTVEGAIGPFNRARLPPP